MQNCLGCWVFRFSSLFIFSIYSMLGAHSPKSKQEAPSFPQSFGISKSSMERLLQDVKAQANQNQLLGWPELPPEFRGPADIDPKNSLLSRIWAQTNKVIWHYQAPTRTWDAIVVLQRTDNRWYPDEHYGTVIHIKNAFGNPKLTPVTRLPYIGLSISPIAEKEIASSGDLPRWVGTGPIWHFMQESDGDMAPAEGIFHSGAGFGWVMNSIETKSEHAKLVESDKAKMESQKAKGINPDDDPYAFEGHSCSIFFAEDLNRAENVRSCAGLVWFHFPTGLEISDFVVPVSDWNALRKKVDGVPKPRPVSTNTSRLTLRSSRTPPALPSALSQLLAISAPLVASVQAGPLSFIR
jgi:hypothetical protein